MAGTEGWSIMELEELRVLLIRQTQLPILKHLSCSDPTCRQRARLPLMLKLRCAFSVGAAMHLSALPNVHLWKAALSSQSILKWDELLQVLP